MLSSLFQKSESYHQILDRIRSGAFPIDVFGFNENAFILHSIALNEEVKSLMLLVETDSMAKEIFDKLSESVDHVGLLRTREISFYREYSHSYQIETERLETVFAACESERFIVVASVSSLMTVMPDPAGFLNLRIQLKRGDYYDLSDLERRFVEMGYERMDIVESKGQFSVKGGIIDIFPILYEKPLRLDFFGDELYQIKVFDVASQTSDEEVETIDIRACAESFKDKIPLEKGSRFTMFDYLERFKILAYGLPRQLQRVGEIYEEYLSRLKEDILEGRADAKYQNLMLDEDTMAEELKGSSLIMFSALQSSYPELEPKCSVAYDLSEAPKYFADFKLLPKDLKMWKDQGYAVLISYASEFQKKRLTEILSEASLAYTILDHIRDLERQNLSSKIFLIDLPIVGGFINEEQKTVLITPSELYQKKNIRKKKANHTRKKIKAFTEIEIGDYVVHESYGIGRYAGIFLKDFAGEEKDMIKIEYSGDEVLFIPVESLDTLHKYLGKDSKKVELHSLSSKKWQKQKAKAKASVDKIAEELVELYAKRREEKGHAFPPDDVWQREFEEMFPYTETPGQMQASYEIKQDMEKPYPMERLLCGDVGYGKTEVALRAIFKCVTNGKQACVLVPTTILAEQHFLSMSNRLEKYPLEVAVLSRFKSKVEQKAILERVRSGMVDLLIGTHRILSDDVEFKNLGLLVVDEEQRFGVAHKEKIKRLKLNVDSLSMTATPIPRTLNMSLMGIKDLSVIEDPPEDRFPIQTYVMEYHAGVIKEVIQRELSRGGQVYYVHNRVDDLPAIQKTLSELMPDTKFSMAHAKMSEHRLEDTLLGFMNGESDVLISTSIIETGLDIPNVNTIIIDDCDRYGLSQLYQLRGRVGRSNRLAYAYLFYAKEKVLSELSEKRLKAIKEFSSLGSGFKLSMRDLELRGSGNIFGKAQSGHISEIGYEMYAKLLEETVDALKGKHARKRVESKIEYNCSAYISESYIRDFRFRIEMYKRISSISSPEERNAIINEMADRFGSVPIETLHLTYIALMRQMASLAGFSLIRREHARVKLYYATENELDLKLVYDILSQVNQSEVKFVAEAKPYFCLDYDTGDVLVLDMMEYTVDFLAIVLECMNEESREEMHD